MIVDLPSTTTSAISKKLVRLRQDVGAMALGRVLTPARRRGRAARRAGHRGGQRREPPAPVPDHRCCHREQARGLPARRPDPRGRRRGRQRGRRPPALRAADRATGAASSSRCCCPTPPSSRGGPRTPHATCRRTPSARWPSGASPTRRTARTPARDIKQRALTYTPGDTDLAWTRITLWRGLLAAALDQPPYEPVTAATVTGGTDSPSADLLAAWLAWALRCPVARTRSRAGSGMVSVRLERRSGEHRPRPPRRRHRHALQPGQPDRMIALPHRSDAECLADELRRLDPDEIYEEACPRACACSAARAMTASEAVPMARPRRWPRPSVRPSASSALDERTRAATWSRRSPRPPMPATPPR